MASFDELLRSVVREEVSRAVAPLASVLVELRAQGARLTRLLHGLGRSRARTAPFVRPWQICSLEGCGRPARSKGFCPAHYQKYRRLESTGRLPRGWREFAPEGSLPDVLLPRGQAGARALAEASRRLRGRGPARLGVGGAGPAPGDATPARPRSGRPGRPGAAAPAAAAPPWRRRRGRSGAPLPG